MKIKDLSIEERPRERLIKHGPKTLSNAELLAIVLRQGSKKENVIELAHRLLQNYQLTSFSKRNITTLKKLSGIGEAKACQLVACFELGKRLSAFNKEKKVQINSAKDVAKLLLPEMSTLKQEYFKGIYLDARKCLIKEETIFIGTLNTSVVHPREVFEPALREGAAGIIVVHNHPSGDPTPSDEDLEVTKQLIEAGTVLGINVLDHIIIGDKKFCSLKDEGYFD